MKNDFDWKQIKGLALIAFICSLPIMLWRSSRVGKVIYIGILAIVLIKVIGYGADKLSTSYFNIQNIMTVRKEIKPVLSKIEQLKESLNTQQINMDKNSNIVQDMAYHKANQAGQVVVDKINSIEANLDQIEKSVMLIRESEREAMKDKILHLREDVLVKKKSIDEFDIRSQCEIIVDKTYLLTDEEKKRFYDNLKDIGFKVKQIEEQSYRIYSGNFSMISGDSVSIRPFGRDDNQ